MSLNRITAIVQRRIRRSEGMGEKRLQILLLIYQGYLRRMPPTVRELMHATGMKSPNSVMSHLYPLRKQGFITWQGKEPRTLQPLYRLDLFEEVTP